jgi:hypothetical protein
MRASHVGSDGGTRRCPRRRWRPLVMVLAVLAATMAMAAPAGASGQYPLETPPPRLSRWVPAPALPSVGITDVSCPRKDWCMGVGLSPPPSQITAAVFNGRKWTPVTVPEENRSEIPFTQLLAVDCSSPKSCVAVGRFARPNTSVDQPYILHWNGRVWRRAITPLPAGSSTGTLDVSCISAKRCVAIGRLGFGGSSLTYALVWDGSTWKLDTLPSGKTAEEGNDYRPDVAAISCVRGPVCVAVGTITKLAAPVRPFALRWDGTTWSVMAPVDPGPHTASFNGVSCLPDSSCMAVGTVRVAGRDQSELALWDGSQWLHVALDRTAGPARLNDITCDNAGCVAVGSEQVGRILRPLVLQGTVASPAWADTTALPNVSLGEVSCRGPRSCFATVGPVFRSSTFLATPELGFGF